LDGLVSGLPPQKRPKRDIAMLQCFVDESYGEAVLVLAGFVADVDTWKAFSGEWQECLDMRPPMERLHMEEVFGDSWGDETKERVARFHRILDHHAVGGVTASLPLRPYEKLFGTSEHWSNPYVYLLFHFIRGYRQHCDKIGLDRKVKFIFDRQKGAAPRIAEAWEFFEQRGNDALHALMGGAPSFESSYEYLPLQAADLSAWWIRRQMEDRAKGKAPPEFPWKIKDSIPSLAMRFSEEHLVRDYHLIIQGMLDAFDHYFPPRGRGT
jgi:hypothetical protein